MNAKRNAKTPSITPIPLLLLPGLLGLLLLGTVLPLGAQTRFLGPEERVNVPARSDSFPSVATNRAGTSAIAWHCDQPGSSSDICIRVYSLSGRPMGPELVVNQSREGAQQFADVAIADDGRFLVVWESKAGEDGDDWTVLGRLFAANGSPLTDEKVLNSQAASRQRDPAVAWRPGSGWVVVWDSVHAGFPTDVWVRLFGPGLAPQGPEKLVSGGLDGLNINAAVDTDADGAFVVAWQGPRQGGGSEVWARRFGSGGSAVGAPFRVATQQPSQKQHPTVAVNAKGEFVVLFSRTDETIAARRYRANGQPRGPEFQVNQGPASFTAASVTLADDGSFVAAWTAAIGSVVQGSFSVRQRAFRANGQPREGEVLVAERGQHPQIALDGAGDVLLVLHAPGPDVHARWSQIRGQCIDDVTVACVQEDRFKVEVAWRTKQDTVGVGTAELLTAETATFWFFDPANVELVLKGLATCSFAPDFWIFAAGATDVEIDLAVTDTEQGIRRRYFNPLGRPFETIRDTAAFPCDGPASTVPDPPRHHLTAPPTPPPTAAPSLAPTAAVGIDRPGETRRGTTESNGTCGGNQELCLSQSRFAVRVRYTVDGEQSAGKAVPLSGDSGYFWFFDDGNVEVLVKVLDGCGINQRFWVLAAGLTDLEVELEVVDTDTVATKIYSSKAGEGFGPVIDVAAFASCG